MTITQPDIRKSTAAASSLVERLPRQVRFAASQALNDSLRAGVEAQRRTMEQVFDRPTPYVLRGAAQVTNATREKLVGTIALATETTTGGNVPAGKPLLAEVKGGTRRLKRSEVLLQRAGLLPAGWLTVPGRGARLDAYGNITRGQILEVLSWFKAYGQQTVARGRARNSWRDNITDAGMARKRRGTRNRAGLEYFAVKPGDTSTRLKPGIYARQLAGRYVGPVGQRPRAVLVFVPMASYAQRFEFAGTAEQAVLAAFPAAYAQRFRSALETAR